MLRRWNGTVGNSLAADHVLMLDDEMAGRRKLIVIIPIVLSVVFVAILSSLRQSASDYPVEIKSAGFKAAGSKYDPAFLFLVTNRTASPLTFRFSYNAAGTSVDGGGMADMQPHGNFLMNVVIPGGKTNGLHGKIVYSATRRLKPWQRRIGTLLGQIGINAGTTLKWEKVYPQCTNVWATP